MSESEGRPNHERGVFSFLGTQWRAFIGADQLAIDLTRPTTTAVHQ
jgi:hypothetical protein